MAGVLFVIAGPSGAGKTTLIGRLLATYQGRLKYSPTYTTRQPRAGEQNGKDYVFINQAEFDTKKQNNFFIETNKYSAYWYGTPRSMLTDVAHGSTYIVAPDINGVREIVKQFPTAITLWITAPQEILHARLIARNTESDAKISERIQRGKEEEAEALREQLFKYIIVNIDLEQAWRTLRTVIEKYLITKKKLF